MNLENTIKNKDQKLSKKYKSEVPNEIVEGLTKKIPNLTFLAAAGVSVTASAMFTFFSKKKELGNFIGLWAPTILLFGVYNKIVKLEDELLDKKTFH